MTELGLTDVTPHELRRTFGSLARSPGADLRWIQKAIGHESITTRARIYAHLYDELDQVATALNGLRGDREGGTARAHAMCPKCAHDRGLEHEESPGRCGPLWR